MRVFILTVLSDGADLCLAQVQSLLEALKYVHPVCVCVCVREKEQVCAGYLTPFSTAPRAERTVYANELLIAWGLFFNLHFIHLFWPTQELKKFHTLKKPHATHALLWQFYTMCVTFRKKYWI